MAFWPTCLYFATYILEFKIGFDHGLQLVNSFQFTGQSYWINNHISSILISPKYSKCQFRHFAYLYIYIFMLPHFACSSWGDHDNDQGNQNWSWYWSRMVWFGISCCIRYYIDKFWLFLGHFWVDIRYVWWTSGCQQLLGSYCSIS